MAETTGNIVVESSFAGSDAIKAAQAAFLPKDKGLTFYSFFHPYTGEFIKRLNQGGISELMTADTDILSDGGSLFNTNYEPATLFVSNPWPAIEVDFNYDKGTYALYNWELFFHAPLYIATRLSKNGKHAEAMKWFHYIFNPTTNKEIENEAFPNARYWGLPPFQTEPIVSIEEFFNNLKPDSPIGNPDDQKIIEWRKNPFKPHLIARGRYLAYMKNVIFKYVENFIAWGDVLFRRDTMETINEATQLYVIAAHILGPRPQFVPKRGRIKAETFNSLNAKLDEFGNAMVELENLFPYSSAVPVSNTASPGSLLGFGEALYFCIPHNDNMLKYWDTVADRLYKIRHCMNIEGVERKLALFEPPIDPAMLVAAAAKGLSISDILSDLNSPAPFYRFSYLSQKATELCSEVKALGNALLSTIEKKDVEALSLIRAQHETELLGMVTAIKERQILEAKAAKQGLERNREGVKKRIQHYLDLLGETEFKIPEFTQLNANLTPDSALPDTIIADLKPNVDVSLVDIDEAGLKLIYKEKKELEESKYVHDKQKELIEGDLLSKVLHLIPLFEMAIKPFGAGAAVNVGGLLFGMANDANTRSINSDINDHTYEASRASKIASYFRREQDWVQQVNMAKNEIIQIDKQLAGADIRIQIAQKELENHQKQITNSLEVEDYIRYKFTNQELYQWMKEQLYFVYKQSYQLAYDMAKKAEKAFGFELGQTITSYIQYGYWDSSYQGLVAGEQLHLAIKQMEKAYIEANRREFELSKNISLAMLNPLALLELKQVGSCEIDLPEELFDLDYPGHYFRRIKSVSISIPSIVGPNTTINCTLRLLNNSIRIDTSDSTSYAHYNDGGVPIDDLRFRENIIPFSAIATSAGQNDSGMFELNFRDERFLPFEGAGAIGKWKLELNGKYAIGDSITDLSQFDYNTISDVIIHMKYTAREDAGLFREGAIANLNNYIGNAEEPFMRLISLKHEFPTEFHQLMNPTGAIQQTEIELSKNHFPYLFHNRTIAVTNTQVFLNPKEGQGISNPNMSIGGAIVEAANWFEPFSNAMKKATINLGEFDPIASMTINAGTEKIVNGEAVSNNDGLIRAEIDDVLILFEFKAS